MKLITLLALSLLSINSLATNQFHEGYLITSANDTLRGFISLDENLKTKAIQFKQSLTDQPRAYSLSEFSSVYLKKYNEYYFSFSLEVDKKPIRLNNLDATPGRVMVNETVLLKLLASGKISLYTYKDEVNKPHFFVQIGDKIEELAYVIYSRSSAVVELRYYIETLKEITKNCDKVRINKPSYNEGHLIPIIANYNSCFEDKKYVKSKEKLKFTGGIILGGSHAGFKYTGEDYTSTSYYSKGASNVNYNTKLSGFGGFFIEAKTRRLSRLGFGFQLLWQKSGNFVGKYEDVFFASQYNANFSFLSPSINLKYVILKAKRGVTYARIGAGFNYTLNSSTKAFIQDKVANQAAYDKSFMNFNSIGSGVYGGIGVSVQKGFIELQLKSNQFIGTNSVIAKVAGANLVVGYYIF
jgi:hypothetical protein